MAAIVGEDGWQKGEPSDTTNCVEAREGADGGVEIRDSKDPDGPVLRFSRAEMRAFVEGAANGDFNNLI
jgi:hypothetical protein